MKPKLPFNFSVVANADNSAPAEIGIRGVIGQYFDPQTYSISDTEADVLNELNKIPTGKKINVRINSKGGDVGLALGCYNALQSRAADVTTINSGYACSSASVLMLAGSKRISPPSSIWMIHRAASTTAGNYNDKLKDAEMLKKHDETMASLYAKAAGGTADDWLKKMDAETWMTGDEAVEFKLATSGDGDGDNDSDAGDSAPDAAEKRIIATFKNIPENLRPKFIVSASASKTPPTPNTQPKKPMKNIINALVAAGFSIPADADESQMLVSVNALIDERNRVKAENKAHNDSREARVLAVIESAITDKVVAETRKAALIKLGSTDENEVIAQISELRAAKAVSGNSGHRGAPPAPKGSGDEPETQESLRAELDEAVKASDGNRIAEITGKLREKRGHGKLFEKEPLHPFFRNQ